MARIEISFQIEVDEVLVGKLYGLLNEAARSVERFAQDEQAESDVASRAVRDAFFDLAFEAGLEDVRNALREQMKAQSEMHEAIGRQWIEAGRMAREAICRVQDAVKPVMDAVDSE